MEHTQKIATPILILIALFIGSFSFSHYIDRTGRIIVVEQYDEMNGDYDEKSEIDDRSVIAKINQIISTTRWDESNEQDTKNADYLFYFQYKQERYETKPVTYYISVGKDRRQVKLIKDEGWSTTLTDQKAQDFMDCIQITW